MKLKNILNKILLENPDQIDIPKEHLFLKYSDKDALPFGYFKNKMIIGKFHMTHQFVDIENKKKYYRNEMLYPGRLWKKHKIISFWVFPPISKIKKIITDINNELLQINVDTLNKNYDFKINNNWMIESINPETMRPYLVSITNYNDPNDLGFNDWDDWFQMVVFKQYN